MPGKKEKKKKSKCLKSEQAFRHSITVQFSDKFLFRMCLKSEPFVQISDTFLKCLKYIQFCSDFRQTLYGSENWTHKSLNFRQVLISENPIIEMCCKGKIYNHENLYTPLSVQMEETG